MSILIMVGLAFGLSKPLPAQPIDTEPKPCSSKYTTTTDPLQAAARKALDGQFGPLRPWQRHWYEVALQHPAEVRTVWLTQYGPWEGYAGDDYHIAANPRYMPLGTVVWLNKPGKLCVVTNRGASFNDRIAKSKGCDHWIDLWTRYKKQYGLNTTTAKAWKLGNARGW